MDPAEGPILITETCACHLPWGFADGIKFRIGDGEIFLDYLGVPRAVPGVPVKERRKQQGQVREN